MASGKEGESDRVRPRRRRWRVVVLVVVAFVAWLPHGVASSSYRDTILRRIAGSDASVSSASSEFGWLTPLRIDDLRWQTRDGEVTLSVERFSAEHPWWRLWLSDGDWGHVELVAPKVEIVTGSDGEAAQGQRSGQWPEMVASIRSGSLTIRDRDQEQAAVNLEGLDAEVECVGRDKGSLLTVNTIELADRIALTSEDSRRGLQMVAPELVDELNFLGTYSLQLTGASLYVGDGSVEAGNGQDRLEGVLTLHDLDVELKNDVTYRMALVAAEVMELGDLPRAIRVLQEAQFRFEIGADGVTHQAEAWVVPELEQGVKVRSRGKVGWDESVSLEASILFPLHRVNETPLAAELAKIPLSMIVSGTLASPTYRVPADQPWGATLQKALRSSDLSAEERKLAEELDEMVKFD